MISIIVAIDSRGAIGREGRLLHHISEDLKRFKRLTIGNTVVMGRKTFDSLPKGALPERRNIVVTRNASFSAPGTEAAHSVEEALAMAGEGGSRVYVIGGAEIYRSALPYADELQLTLIDASTPDADTFFPDIDPEEWHAEEVSEDFTDAKSGLRYRFTTLRRTPRAEKDCKTS